MQTYQVGLIALGILGILASLAFLSWRRKVAVQSAIIPAPRFLEDQPVKKGVLYVTTTFADRPLDRVFAHGLGNRGFAEIRFSNLGVEIFRTGEKSFLIPANDLVSVARSTAVIDRVVEDGGLTSIRWRLGENELETHFRFVSATLRAQVLAELSQMVGA